MQPSASPLSPPSASPCFFIGKVPIYGDLVLAPMDGYTDLPFRSLCRELGSALSTTEFINALDVINGHPYLHEKLAFWPAERPLAYQVFDNDPERLVVGALKLQEHQPDILDVNLGCAARTVSGRGAGAGLLRTPEKIAAIFQGLKRALDIPITAKIRLGWDDSSRNYMQVVKILEDNGADAITVHARTRAQGLSGQADWDAIAEVRQAVSIPVIANGDVRKVADIERIKSHTGCPGVMIGRAAIGHPWIFSRLDRWQVSAEAMRQGIDIHLQRMLDFYGAAYGLVLFRKHISRYLHLYPLLTPKHQLLMTTRDVELFKSTVDAILRAGFHPRFIRSL